jgi:hypothetical protein
MQEKCADMALLVSVVPESSRRSSVVNESHAFRGERLQLPARRLPLEVFAEVAELFDRQQAAWRRWCGDFIVFEDPRIAMWDEDGV